MIYVLLYIVLGLLTGIFAWPGFLVVFWAWYPSED